MCATATGTANRCRRLVLVVCGAVMLVACGGDASRAPVVERNTTGSAGGAGGPRVSAGTEVDEGDWTATVRTLGDGDRVAPRTLPVATDGASTQVNPAVVSLLNTASAQFRAGDYVRAAATLERAIAIEPDNAWLWHRLAIVRLHEGRLDQAVELAAKSSSLASADRRLRSDNWKLVAEVRRRQGDPSGASAAEAQARKLAN